MAKYLASEAAWAAADAAVQFHGGAGMDRSVGVFDLFAQIRVNRIVPLNNEMALNFIGERALGLPKSY
jgi:alkylation response protein AidB-like acyl-CoA dehydrogenase